MMLNLRSRTFDVSYSSPKTPMSTVRPWMSGVSCWRNSRTLMSSLMCPVEAQRHLGRLWGHERLMCPIENQGHSCSTWGLGQLMCPVEAQGHSCPAWDLACDDGREVQDTRPVTCLYEADNRRSEPLWLSGQFCSLVTFLKKLLFLFLLTWA